MIFGKKHPLIADLHVHTLSSGHAYSTIEEYARRAKKIGIKYIAMADHGPSMPGAPHYYHFANLVMLPKYLYGVRILRGVEANIVDATGKLDLSVDDLDRLDVVMVAMHPVCGYESQGEKKNTEVLLAAIEKYPQINILAHPGNPRYPVEIETVVAFAKQKNVIVEINNSSFTGTRKGCWERCLAFAREVKKQDWVVIIGSDSHQALMLGTSDLAFKLLKEADFPMDKVVNTSEKLIKRHILERKGVGLAR